MTHEFEIGGMKVTVEGVPEGLEPDVDVCFHHTTVEQTQELVDAMGGRDALTPLSAMSICLVARTGPEFGAPSCEVHVFPRDEDKRSEPANGIVRDFWREQRAAAA